MDAKAEFQKKIKYLSGLEKKVRRLLLREKYEEAVELLQQIIEEYRDLGAFQKARYLEEKLRTVLAETNMNLEGIEEITTSKEERIEQVLFYIEALEKKVKRRLLQGKEEEAIEDLKYIITQLRRLKLYEKADLLETTLNQFIMELSGEYDQITLDSVSTTSPLPSSSESHSPVLESPGRVSNLHPSPPDKPMLQTPSPQNNVLNQSEIPKQDIKIHSITERIQPAPEKLQPQVQPRSKSVVTIKDQPLSEEEILLKKLLEIKDMLQG
ncbi:MAG: hypothetical protein ACTSYB_09945 [Candidatus Helarchaeota archaeon]